MGRPRKAAASTEENQSNEEVAVNGQEIRRSTRKRTVVTNVTVESDDEPVVKKGRKPAQKKNAKKNDAAPVSVKIEVDDGVDSTSGAQKAESKKKSKVKKEPVDDTSPSTSAGASSGKGKKSSTKKIKEEEEETTLPAKTTGGVEKKNKSKKKKGSGKENVNSSNIPSEKKIKSGVERVVVVKGRAAVDAVCPIAMSSHVLEEEDDDIWDCMLNQTNIQFNNNKYYLIQLLKDDEKNVYSVWMRWGRVGANGQNALHACGGDLQKAKNIFMKKFSDKTKNDWDMRDCFEKVPGKYDLLAMDYSSEDTTDAASAEAKEKAKEDRKKIECKLETRVRALIELICDLRIMEETVIEMKYDARKAPLGKLTTEQIRAGYKALKAIDDILKGKYTSMELVHACNAFYTRIPHYFGMKVPPVIRTKAEIQEKVALLDALGDIQAALSVMDQPIDVNVHPVDQHYTGLQCNITSLEKMTDDYKVLESYLLSTHAKTHSNYKMELLEVFACKKDLEYDRYKNVGNCMLLWHGSRLSNWAGILSQGLRIAPPEAPSTGYMFGKGIYFADMSSKSGNYCWATQRNDVGFLALSEVSLGKMNEILHADYNASKLPKGCHSVKGCGRFGPLPETYSKLSDGTVVPLGPGKETGVDNPKGYTLLYNEYIVYNPTQVRTRFLLKVKFHFR